MSRKSRELAAIALTTVSMAPSTFASTLAVPAVHIDPLDAKYDPQMQLLVLRDGNPAYLQQADTTVAYSQFQRPTGTPTNRDLEWYSAPDGFKVDG